MQTNGRVTSPYISMVVSFFKIEANIIWLLLLKVVAVDAWFYSSDGDMQLRE